MALIDKNYSLALQVANYLTNQQQCLAVAESCTGGGIGACLTELPGSSAWFCGGIISYSNQVKIDLLNVKPTDLHEYGAVSQPVAESMALGALSTLNADVSISVSGIAGPSGGENKPVGTVWIAWAYAQPPLNDITSMPKVYSQHFLFFGNRHSVRQQAIDAALRGVIKFAHNNK